MLFLQKNNIFPRQGLPSGGGGLRCFCKKTTFFPVKNWDTPEAAREAEARELAQQDEALRHKKRPGPA